MRSPSALPIYPRVRGALRRLRRSAHARSDLSLRAQSFGICPCRHFWQTDLSPGGGTNRRIKPPPTGISRARRALSRPLLFRMGITVRGALRNSLALTSMDSSIYPRVRGALCHLVRGPSGHSIYPRVCGALLTPLPNSHTWSDLSPRVRGSVLDCCCSTRSLPIYPRVCGALGEHHLSHFRVVRSIPACAGLCVLAGREHFSVLDLSPSSRGPGAFPPFQCDVTRSIPAGAGLCTDAPGRSATFAIYPACAGLRDSSKGSTRFFAIYPSTRGGVLSNSLIGALGCCDLSPRVRGSDSCSCRYLKLSRSIPACAGLCAGEGVRCLGIAIYPRVCGALLDGDLVALQLGDLSRVCRALGSATPKVDDAHDLSARVRGSAEGCRGDMPGQRSIPACAGLWISAIRGGPLMPIYPRVHGALPISAGSIPSSADLSPRVRGSGPMPAPVYAYYLDLSPRVRGSVGVRTTRPEEYRSIPACAGLWADGNAISPHALDLSPRVRGSGQQQLPGAHGRRRSIPACAGLCTN